MRENYSFFKKKLGFKLVSSKPNFGNHLDLIQGNNNNKIYDNGIRGGLLNYWGGVLQKFNKRTLNLSLKIDDLDDYYKKVAQNIPVTQVVNKIKKIFIQIKKI